MFNSELLIKRFDNIIKCVYFGYQKMHKEDSNKVFNIVFKKLKLEMIDLFNNVNFLDEMDVENTHYDDGIYVMPIDSIDNFISCSPYFSTIVISIKNRKIEWGMIFFPALSLQVVFNGYKVFYNIYEIQGYPPLYLNEGVLNGIDFMVNKEYFKYLNINTIITRNSQSVLLMLLMNKFKSGIITKQLHAILNRLIEVMLQYSNGIEYKKEGNYFIVKKDDRKKA